MVDAMMVVLLVGAGDASTPTTTAMARAAGEALESRVEVRESAGAPNDGEALAIEASSGAAAVAEVSWEPPDRRRARIRVHLARSQRWFERAVKFQPTDPDAERGRTLGFAIALLLPNAVEREEAAAQNPSPAPSAGTTSAAPSAGAVTAPPKADVKADVPSQPSSADPAGASPSTDARTAPPQAPPKERAAATHDAPSADPAGREAGGTAPDRARSDHDAPPRDGRAHSVEVDVFASGAIDVPGNGQTFGGGGAVHWAPLPFLSLRLGASGRVGTIDAAAASLSFVDLTAGASWHALGTAPGERFGLALRVDYLLSREQATHVDVDDSTPVARARWLSGFDAFVEASWVLTSEIGLFAAVGGQDLFAYTYIDIRGRQVGTLPPVRALAEGGFRLRF